MPRMRSVFALMLVSLFIVMPMSVSAATSLDQVFSELESQYRLPNGILAKIAQVESGGNPNARNAPTDAVGLFQWLPKSWEGATYALYRQVLDPNKRRDPVTSAKVTAFTLAQIKSQNGALVQQAGIDPSLGLYMGHFLGPTGAKRFLQAYIQNPNTNAASISPREAQYNQGVFRSRTLAEVLNFLANKLKVAGVKVNIPGDFSDGMGNSLSYSNADVKPSDFFPKSYVPTGQDPSRTYQADYSSSAGAPSLPPLTTEQLAAPSSGPSELLMISQQSRVPRDGTTLVSWTSVGMQPNSCKVSQGNTVLWTGEEGTRNLPRDLTTQAGDIVLTFACISQAGSAKESAARITVE